MSTATARRSVIGDNSISLRFPASGDMGKYRKFIDSIKGNRELYRDAGSGKTTLHVLDKIGIVRSDFIATLMGNDWGDTGQDEIVGRFPLFDLSTVIMDDGEKVSATLADWKS